MDPTLPPDEELTPLVDNTALPPDEELMPILDEGPLPPADASSAAVPGGLKLFRPGGIERDDARLQTIFRTSFDKNVDRHADILNLSRETGVKADVIEANYDAFKKSWETANFDATKWREANPEQARLILDNPGWAPVQLKDEKMSWLARQLRELKAGFDFWNGVGKAPAQGFDPRVEELLKQGQSWDEIGATIQSEVKTDASLANRVQSDQVIDPLKQKYDSTMEQLQHPQQVPTVTDPSAAATGIARPWDIFTAEYQRNQKGLERSQLGFGVLWRKRLGRDTWDQEKKIADLDRELFQRDYNAGPVEQVLVDLAGVAPSQVSSLKATGVGGAAGAVVGGTIGAAVGAASDSPDAAVTLGKKFAMKGAELGAKSGAALQSFQLEAGSAYLDFRQMTTDDGRPISDNAAMGAAIIYGEIAAGIEVMSVGKLLEAYGPLGKAIKAGSGKAAMTELLKDKGFLKLATEAGKAWLESAASEGGEEFSQQVAQDALGYVGKSVSAGQLQQAQPFESFVSGADAAYLGALGGVAAAAPGPLISLTTEKVMGVTHETIQRDKAIASQAHIAAMNAAADSPTVKADPHAAARIVADASGESGDPVTHVYVDPDAFVTYFQSKNTDPAVAAKELLGEQGPTYLQQAIAEGSRLEVPTADWMSKWAPTEAGKALAPHAATQRTLATGAQLQRKAQEDAEVQKLAEKYANEGVEPQSASEAKFLDVMEQQLAATGTASKRDARTQLSLLRALIRTVPERFGGGMTADQLFSNFAIAIGKGSEPMAVGTGEQTQDVEPGSLPQLREDFGKMSREAQVRALVLDRNTGLLNSRGFRALAPDPARPFLAEFDLEGKKLFNDEHGHESLDGGLRVMARAIRAAGVKDAAALGGAIKAYVSSADEADQLAQKLEDAVNEGRPADARRIRVTAGVADTQGPKVAELVANGAHPLDAAFEAAGGAHKEVKAQEKFRKRLGERKGWPLAFTPDNAPENINWEDLPNHKGLSLKSPEFKALMKDAAAKAADTAARFKAEPVVDRFAPTFDTSGITDAVREHVDSIDSAHHFDAVHRDDTGMLTEDGFARAREVAKKKFVVSADLRGLKDLNDAFGKAGADVVIDEFKRLMIANGGQRFDAAHPHGDEFFAQGDDEEDLKRYFYALQYAANRHVFVQYREGGGGVLQVGVHFVHGIGETLDEADRVALPAAKERQGDVPKPRELSRSELERELNRLEREGYPEPVRIPEVAADRVREGAGGVRQAEPQEVDPETLAEIRQSIGRMRGQGREVAFAFLDYVLDPESNSKPIIEPQLERWFLDEYGLYDPLNPPRADLSTGRVYVGDQGPAQTKRSGKRRGSGKGLTGELLKARLMKTMSAEEFSALGYDAFKQDPNGNPDARGFTVFAQKGLMKIARIALNPTADLSTFLHESAHVFLEMFGDLAERPDAPEQVKNDYATALRYLGVEKRSEVQRDQHEKWAKSFEAYLFEGKAPSFTLAGAFQRFKLWLTQVYRSVAGLGVELNDDIRGVFDRLLATDKEIETMKARMGISAPLFRSPEHMSQVVGRAVTPEEWQSYQDAYNEAHANAARAVELRVLKDKLRESESWWKEETKRHRDLGNEVYEGLPERAAQQFLWGRGPHGNAVIHLDRAAVEAVVSPEDRRKFPLRKNGGTDPGEVAPLFGFETGDAMVKAIAALKDKDEWVKEWADEVMRGKYPELLDEREKLRERVAQGLHGEHTAKWLDRELKALGSKTTTEQIRKAAEQIARNRRAGRLDAGAVLAQERSAANQALAAMTKGDYARAAGFKVQQTLNMFLHRELTKAREDRESFLDLAAELRKPPARARLGKAAPIYRDGVDMLLETFGLAQPRQRETPLPSVAEVVAQMDTDGASVMFDVEELAQLVERNDPWQSLSVAQMRSVWNALRNIQGAARTKNRVLLEGKRVEKEEVVKQLVAEAALVLREKGAATTKESETLTEKAGRLGSSIDGWMLRMETMIGFLVNDDVNSTWFRAIINPLQEGKHKETDILEHVVRPVMEAFDQVPKAVRARFMETIDGKALFPGHREDLTPPRRRYELLMMALNYGNEGNAQRLRDGRGITDAQIRTALDLLTKEEIDWVQAVWDASENKVTLPGETEAKSLRDRAFDLEERDSGLRPEAVQARPFATKAGEYRGGYFPVVYHQEVENVGKLQEGQALSEILDQSFTRPGTPHGHLKERAAKYVGAISFSPGVIYGYLSKAAHDIAYREPLKSAASLLMTPEVQDALRARLGPEKAKLFVPWLRDIGTMRAGMDWSGLNRITQWLRSNMAPALLGWRPSIPVGDAANLAVAGLDLNPAIYAKAVKDYGASLSATEEFILSKSGEMRSRRGQLVREFTSAVKSLTETGPLKKGPIGWYRKHGFFFMEQSDRLTSMPPWLAMYRQAIAEGRNEQDAVRLADKFVRDRYPSHNAVDLSHLLRDKGFWGMVSVFAGYSNVLWNRQRHILQQWMNAQGFTAGEKTKLTAKTVGKLLALWTTGNVLAAGLMAQGPDKKERWWQWFLRRLAMAPFENFHAEIGGSVGALLTGQRPNPRGSPVSSYLETVGGAAVRAAHGEDKGLAAVKSVIQAIGLSTGTPYTPINNVLDVLFSTHEDALDVAHDAYVGDQHGK